MLSCIRGGYLNCVDVIKNKEDIEKIKAILKCENYRNYFLFLMGINTGLRICQILSLKVGDLLNEGIEVKKFILVDGIEYALNETIRTNFFHYIGEDIQDIDRDMYLFKSTRGNHPIERVQAYRILNAAGVKAGLDIKFGTHTLRKTFGYHFYLQYRDLKYLQKLFHHSNINMTANYIGINEENLVKNYSSFDL